MGIHVLAQNQIGGSTLNTTSGNYIDRQHNNWGVTEMEFTLKINLDNAAFTDYPDELARKIEAVAQQARGWTPDSGSLVGVVFDVNGNRCGLFETTEPGEFVDRP